MVPVLERLYLDDRALTSLLHQQLEAGSRLSVVVPLPKNLRLP